MNNRIIWLYGFLTWILVDYVMRIFGWVLPAALNGVSVPLDAFPFTSFVVRNDWYLLPTWFCLLPPFTLIIFFLRSQNTFTIRHGLAFGVGFSLLSCLLATIWLVLNKHSLASIGGQYWVLRFCLYVPGPVLASLVINSIQKKALA